MPHAAHRPRRLVLAGAGHAHLGLLRRAHAIVRNGVHLTVIGPGPRHYYSGMGPGMLSRGYTAEAISFPVKHMTEAAGGVFLEDRVIAVDPEARALILASGAHVEYDIASFNVGSRIPHLPRQWDNGADQRPDIIPVKPIENLLLLRERVLARLNEGKRPVRVVFAGGGAAGFEVAINLAALGRREAGPDPANGLAITLVAGSRLLKAFAPRARRIALARLERLGVAVLEGERAQLVIPEGVMTDAERLVHADVVVECTGTKAPAFFAEAGLPVGPRGGLRVDGSLRCTERPELFGGGDCVDAAPPADVDKTRAAAWPQQRVGAEAVRMADILTPNVMAALEDAAPPRRYIPKSRDFMLLFNLGDGDALFTRNGLAFRHRLWMILKDRIDKRFMRMYQPTLTHEDRP